MLKKIGRILLGILLISLMVACIVFIVNNNRSTAENSGTITVLVNNKDNKVLSKKDISYKEGDTLFEVLDREYKLEYNTSTYGHYLLSIDDIHTDFYSSWLWIEIGYIDENGEYDIKDSPVGVDQIEIKDKMIVGISERDSLHQASIINNTEVSNNTDYFKIGAYIIAGLFLIGIIIYFIISKKNNKMTVKELAILSLMTVIIFVQEELLSVLPNIQLTFLLFAVYTAVFGYKRTMLIACCHVLLDNLLMGSMTPIVVIPMLLGYIIYITLIAIIKNKGLPLIILFASIGSLIYCYLFLVANAIFLDIDVLAYFIADIPFEILLVLSTIITILYLYRPLTKKLNELWNPKDSDILIDYNNNQENN